MEFDPEPMDRLRYATQDHQPMNGSGSLTVGVSGGWKFDTGHESSSPARDEVGLGAEFGMGAARQYGSLGSLGRREKTEWNAWLAEKPVRRQAGGDAVRMREMVAGGRV